jgi:hypothetical protein
VDLTATVSGTATGTINYSFYCNRSDTGTNITSGWAAKFDGITETPKTATDSCNYWSAGTYTAKVIVERATLAAEARVTITATAPFALSKPPFPVIFIHGIASSAGAWASFGRYLSDNGWIFGGFPTFDPATGQVSGVDGPGDFYTMNFSDYDVPDFPSPHLTLERQGLEVDSIIQAVLAANPGKSHVILVQRGSKDYPFRLRASSIPYWQFRRLTGHLLQPGCTSASTELI